MQAFANEPQIRAEKRRNWQIRAGAWKKRAEAEAALARLKARGVKDPRVLLMETPVAWLLPDGRTLNPGERVAETRAAPPPEPVPPPAEPRAAPKPAPVTSTVPAGSPVYIPPPPLPPARPVATEIEVSSEFRTAAERLDAELRRVLRVDGPRQRDGFLYGMDMAPMLLYAAQRGDQTLYLTLRPFAVKLIVDDASEPFARGFVLWRQKDAMKPEISGATEALWMARALWTGAAVFNRAEDRVLAQKVLDGYARHAYELPGVRLQGVWLVRKYFAFDGRTFAGLSALGNYHADFMRELERDAPRAELRDFAERSYAAIERARAPSDILYPLIQPEVGATYPELNVTAYAPNGWASLHDACQGAAGVARGAPDAADELLDFARDGDHTTRSGRLYAYFDTADGDPAGRTELSPAGYGCLGQLAAARNDRRAFREFEPWLTLAMRDIANVPSVQMAPFYDGSQLLLAAYAGGAFNPR